MVENIQGSLSVQSASSVNTAKAVSISESTEKQVAPKNIDEYIPGEEKEPIGLYRVSHDEQGDKTVKFNAPKTEQTTNTDSVDREIKNLKKRLTDLQNALKSAAPENAAQLQKQLEQINAELALKDSDNYRRANAIFS